MQHWFFNNNSGTESPETASIESNRSPVGNSGRLHTFRVLVNQRLEPGEQVAVTGECSSLGHWLPAHCVQLNRENGEFIPRNKYTHNQLFPVRQEHFSCFNIYMQIRAYIVRLTRDKIIICLLTI